MNINEKLHQFAELYAPLQKFVEGLTEEERDELLSNNEELNAGNCWWAVYQSPPVASLIVERLRQQENEIKISDGIF